MKLALGAMTVACLMLFAASTLAGGGPRTKVESRTSSGDVTSAESDLGSVTPNGRYVAFNSDADNLPGTDGGNTEQVFLRDRKTGKVTLVSRANNGDPGDDTSEDASVSANGRRIVFESEASNLPGGVVDIDQVYVRDLKTDRTKLVSKTSGGTPADDESFDGAISANGKIAVFESHGDNLPGALASDELQVYVHDIKRGKTKLASRTSAGAPADQDSQNSGISASGRIVIFESQADNLPGAHGNGDYQAYRRDLKTGRTKLVSKTSAGIPADGDSFDVQISDSGRHVAFTSYAENLPGAVSGFSQVYLHNRKTGKTKLVSRTSGGDPADGGYSQNGYPSIDGRFVAFESDATNLPEANGFTQIYLRDMKRGRTTLISQNNAGEPALEGGDTPSNRVLAKEASIVFFDASGDNLPGVDDQVYSRGPLR
jgi:Tol biopolymer transport system component